MGSDRFAHAPEEQHRALYHAGDVLAPACHQLTRMLRCGILARPTSASGLTRSFGDVGFVPISPRGDFCPTPSRAGAPDSRGTAKTIQTSAHAIDQGQRDKCGAARSLSRLWSLEPAEAPAVMFSVHKI